MYNNIGLKTVRGSGTNGYVQTNLAKLPANWDQFRGRRRGEHPEAKKTRIFKPDPKLIEHNTKRAIEVKVFEFRTKLEDQDFGDDDIEDKVEAYRKVLQAQLEAGTFVVEDPKKAKAKHEDAMDRMKKNLSMKKALGINEDHVHGQAFDQDLQESQRRDRIAKRELEMTLEEKISSYNRNYLDRMGERSDRNTTLVSRRERHAMEQRTRFSRSRSGSRGLTDTRDRKRKRESRREARSPIRDSPRRPERIERWNPDDDKPTKHSGDSDSKRKKRTKKKKKKKKSGSKKRKREKVVSSSSEPEREQSKREERKKRAMKNKKSNDSDASC